MMMIVMMMIERHLIEVVILFTHTYIPYTVYDDDDNNCDDDDNNCDDGDDI